MKTSAWSINPFLKYLYIEDICFNNLFSFLSFTPQLHSLRSAVRASFNVPHQSIILNHLEKVNLNLRWPRFAQLQMLKEIMPNLKSFRLRGRLEADDEDYFKENLWYKLLDNIKYFHVNLHHSAYYEARKTIFKNRFQNFNGKSWFRYEETQRSVNIYIKFQSVTSQ
jgi:hypothetical protein